MSRFARARTDEYGHRLMGEYPGNMKARPLVEKRRDIWDIDVGLWRDERLGDLLGKNSMHLLASHLLNEEGFSADTRCLHAKRGIVRAIRIRGFEYRADTIRVFVRNASR